jgi:hypothetical protein
MAARRIQGYGATRTGTRTRRVPHSSVNAGFALSATARIVNCSTALASGSTRPAPMATRCKDVNILAGSVSGVVLKTMRHSLACGTVKITYRPGLSLAPPMVMLSVIVRVVGSLAPVRQTGPSGTRLSTDRPRALGRL